MDRIVEYRQLIRKLLSQYGEYKPAVGDIRTELIFDTEHDHYELARVGWQGSRRVHGMVIHIDIIDGKIWIEHDGTSPGIALELVEAGVPREDIVLGFRPPHARVHTGFAVA